jgi:Domain of unknown function DUF11
MFEKLLALLPYNPGLLHQMSFYSRRMREEAAIRRTGLIFLILAFMVQFFAVLSPPVVTSAYSTNDLIDGGISSASDAAGKCDGNVKSYKDIMKSFGITCDEIAKASTVEIKSTDFGGKLYSFGWLPQGQVNHSTGRQTGEEPFSVLNSTQDIYGRWLHSWDSYAYSSYKALRVVNGSGQVYFILYTCGNLVAIGVPKEIPRCVYNSNILATSDKCFKPCQYNTSIPASSSQCYKPCAYNSSISSSSPGCFAHCPLPGLSAYPQNSPKCQASCPYNSSLPASSSQCFPPCQYNQSIASSSPQCFPPCQYNQAIASTSPQCFPPCQYNNSISASDSNCKPCEKSLSSEDTLSCISVHKTASNVTTGGTNADGTTANPGDSINYTLYATNNGKAAVNKYTFQENLSYVVDYANVTDLHGGTIDNNNTVTWPSVSISPGQTVTKEISVKVKNPIPSTPVDPGDPNLYNLTMTNVYGNTITIKVPPTPTVTVENTAASLPNTGPGTGLFIAGLLIVVGGYFFARARLLALESAIAVHDNSGGLN